MEENERTEETPAPVEPGEESETPAEEEAIQEGEPEDRASEESEQSPADADAGADQESPTRRGGQDVSAGAEQPAGEDSQQAPAGRPDLPPGAELEPITIEPERQLGAEERARLEAEAEERARLEAEATAERVPEPEIRPQPRVSLDSERLVQATGKRKSSVARVIVRAGGGEFTVNGRALDAYFPRPHLQSVARQPLVVSGYEETVDVRARVQGGGVAGQADAIRHGVARALAGVDPELRGELKRRGLLTRDARIKERRKAGLKKARKRPQFSKR
jgi:small subunit ribosomal protein S9